MATTVTGNPDKASSDDINFATQLATDAGQLLMRLRTEHGFKDPKKLKTIGDAEANRFIVDAIGKAFPNDAILSEEATGEDGRTGTARLSASRVWIIDPLDGTREYAEEGRTDWAVHIALWEKGIGLTATAIALPAQGKIHNSHDFSRPAPLREGKPRIAVSRTRPAAQSETAAQALGAELVPMGSAGAKIAAVVTGDVDAYVHAGGQWEWDSAAPIGVAIAAGLFTSRIDGSPLQYNADNPYLPDLIVCHPDLSEGILDAVKNVTS